MAVALLLAKHHLYPSEHIKLSNEDQSSFLKVRWDQACQLPGWQEIYTKFSSLFPLNPQMNVAYNETWRGRIKHLKEDGGQHASSLPLWLQPLLSVDRSQVEISRARMILEPQVSTFVTSGALVSWHFLFPFVSQLICFPSYSWPRFQANKRHSVYINPLLS